MLRRFAFDCEHCGPFDDKPHHRTGMLVPSGLLTGSERDLTHIDRGNRLCPQRNIEQRPANNFIISHAVLDVLSRPPVAALLFVSRLIARAR